MVNLCYNLSNSDYLPILVHLDTGGAVGGVGPIDVGPTVVPPPPPPLSQSTLAGQSQQRQVGLKRRPEGQLREEIHTG